MPRCVAGAHVPFVHRKLADGDSYFVVNPQATATTIEAHLRVTGKVPELWHADTGAIEPVSYRIANGETVVTLPLAAEESVHIVLRKPATEAARTVPVTAPAAVASLAGSWQVRFQPGRGAPAEATLAQLAPLNDNADPAIRYFSGIATYAKDFAAPAGWHPGRKLWLDLGEVRELAEVRVNGQPVGTAWHAPYRLEIGAAVHRGANHVEIRVADLWVNRLIGDAQPGVAHKITWTALPAYKASAPLQPAGLIGPVTVLAEH
jgi:hypothetical protein